MKLAGAVLVLLGGAAVFCQFSLTQRSQMALIRDMAAALAQLAGEIRWKLLPLPNAIGHLRNRKRSGEFFGTVLQSVESGFALQVAWENAAQIMPPELQGILFAMEWGGDLKQQEGSILYAAKQMSELSEKKSESLRQREKLCAAATLSAAGLLVLILM